MNRYLELNNDKSPKTNYDTFYTEYDNLESAGLILDENTVVVDLDMNPHIALKLLSEVPTRAVKTKRGYHLYYKVPKDISIKNTTHTVTLIGTTVDYKTGFGGKSNMQLSN